jgi:integrase
MTRCAMRADLVMRNVADLDKPPRRAEYVPQMFTVEQARAFIAVIREDRFYALYLLALTTGMRKGELLALTWDALDLDAGTLAVTATQRKQPGQFVVNTPKTAAGKRPLVLHPIAVAALRAQRVRRAEERLQLGEAWGDASLIFPNRVGRRIAGTAFYQVHYVPVLKRAAPTHTLSRSETHVRDVLAAARH